MEQVILVIYVNDSSYVSLLHAPQSKEQMLLWVQAEMCKPAHKGKEWDLFRLTHTGKGLNIEERLILEEAPNA